MSLKMGTGSKAHAATPFLIKYPPVSVDPLMIANEITESDLMKYCQTHSQEECRVRRTTPNLPKGSFLVTKWVFCRWVKGDEVQKVNFGVKKVNFWGVLHLPKINPGYTPKSYHLDAIS